MEREGVSILSIPSYLRALRCLAHVLKYVVFLSVLKNVLRCLSAAICFMITLVSVLKSVDIANVFESVFLKCFCVSAKVYFEHSI